MNGADEVSEIGKVTQRAKDVVVRNKSKQEMLKTTRLPQSWRSLLWVIVRTKEIWVTVKTPLMRKIPIIKTLIQKIESSYDDFDKNWEL